MIYLTATCAGLLFGSKVNVFVFAPAMVLTAICVLAAGSIAGLDHGLWSAAQATLGLQSGFFLALMARAYARNLKGPAAQLVQLRQYASWRNRATKV